MLADTVELQKMETIQRLTNQPLYQQMNLTTSKLFIKQYYELIT